MNTRFQPLPLVLLFGLVAIGSIAMAVAAAAASEPTDQATEESTAAADNAANVDEHSRPALQAGKVIHIDPQTGRKVALPSAAQRAEGRAHLQSMVNRSSVGLIETASPTSGVMVNLQGRFRHVTSLSLDTDGQATTRCAAALPPAKLTEEVDND